MPQPIRETRKVSRLCSLAKRMKSSTLRFDGFHPTLHGRDGVCLTMQTHAFALYSTKSIRSQSCCIFAAACQVPFSSEIAGNPPYYSIETETVAAHVAEHIGGVQTIGIYVQRVCLWIIHILLFVPVPCGSHIIFFHFVPLFKLS